MTPPDRILILRLSALGDVIHTLPALAHLRAALPAARIGWVVEERCAPLLQDHPHLDRLHVVPRRDARAAVKVWKLAAAAALLGGVVREIRGEHYALACDFQGNAKSALFGLLSAAGERLGYAPPDCKEGNHLFTSRQLDPMPPRQSRCEKYLAMARAVSGRDAPAAPVVPVGSAARERAEAWWRAAGTGPRLLLAPGASVRMPEKRWPAPHYGALAAALREHCRAVPAVTYGAGERALAEAVAAAAGGAAVPSEPPPLADLIALIATCDGYVGNDSAPTHLAGQLGKPVVALFGPTSPVRFQPWGPAVEVVQAQGPCAACDRGAVRGDDTHACLPALLPAHVLPAAARALSAAPTRS